MIPHEVLESTSSNTSTQTSSSNSADTYGTNSSSSWDGSATYTTLESATQASMSTNSYSSVEQWFSTYIEPPISGSGSGSSETYSSASSYSSLTPPYASSSEYSYTYSYSVPATSTSPMFGGEPAAPRASSPPVGTFSSIVIPPVGSSSGLIAVGNLPVLQIGLTVSDASSGNDDSWSSWFNSFMSAPSSGQTLVTNVAWFNSQISNATQYVGDASGIPAVSAFLGLVGGTVQSVTAYTAGNIAYATSPVYRAQTIVNNVVTTYDTFTTASKSAGGGYYGALFGISAVTGVNKLADAYFGFDSVTGEKLNGDQRFDRGVEH